MANGPEPIEVSSRVCPYPGANCDKLNSEILDDIITSKPVLVGLSIVVVVLSFGVVAALLLLIHLCFMKPDAANILLPIIIGALVPSAAHIGGKAIATVKANKRINAKSSAAEVSSGSTKELGDNPKAP